MMILTITERTRGAARVSEHATEDAAEAALAAYCRKYWPDTEDSGDCPEDDADVIEAYFNERDDEEWTITPGFIEKD